MPNFTSSLRISSTVNGSSARSGLLTDVAPTDTESSLSIPASTANQLLTISIVRANTQFFLILADQACTVDVNAPSGGSPAQTINLKANIPFYWSASGYYAQPLLADVTALYITTTVGTNVIVRNVTN